MDILTLARKLAMQSEAEGKGWPRFLGVPKSRVEELVDLARSMDSKNKLILPRGVPKGRDIMLENIVLDPMKPALQIRLNIVDNLMVAT